MVRYYENKGGAPKTEASWYVTITLVVHIGLIFAILKKIFSLSYASFSFSDEYLINKLYMLPFALVLMVIVDIIFRKQYKKIALKYDGRRVLTFKNGVFVISILIIPIVAIFLILWDYK